MKSKQPPMGLCTACGNWRQVHQRNDPDTGEEKILCKNCYLRIHPPKRPRDFCRHCQNYKKIVGRGLCRACYDKLRHADELDRYPTKR
jgi:hypothetical protein